MNWDPVGMTNCDLVCPQEVCHLLTQKQVSAMGSPVLLEGGVELSALSLSSVFYGSQCEQRTPRRTGLLREQVPCRSIGVSQC